MGKKKKLIDYLKIGGKVFLVSLISSFIMTIIWFIILSIFGLNFFEGFGIILLLMMIGLGLVINGYIANRMWKWE